MTYFQIHTLDYMVKIQCKGGKNTSNMRLIEGKNTIYDKYSINCLAGAIFQYSTAKQKRKVFTEDLISFCLGKTNKQTNKLVPPTTQRSTSSDTLSSILKAVPVL